MSETNGSTNTANGGVFQSTGSSSSDPAVNGTESRTLTEMPIPPQEAKPEAPTTPPVIDPELGETDLRVSVHIKVHGRKLKILDRNFGTIFDEGLEPGNRGLFFQAVNRLLDETKQVVAIKTNRAAPYAFKETTPGAKPNAKNGETRDPIPPFMGRDPDEDPEIPPLHIPPPLDQ